jgi:Flp pilus assembly protein TadB
MAKQLNKIYRDSKSKAASQFFPKRAPFVLESELTIKVIPNQQKLDMGRNSLTKDKSYGHMAKLKGNKLVIFWIVVIGAILAAFCIMFLGFNPIIGNPLITVLVIALIFVVGILGAWCKFKRWGWY